MLSDGKYGVVARWEESCGNEALDWVERLSMYSAEGESRFASS
jgi:hypothetical protein